MVRLRFVFEVSWGCVFSWLSGVDPGVEVLAHRWQLCEERPGAFKVVPSARARGSHSPTSQPTPVVVIYVIATSWGVPRGTTS